MSTFASLGLQQPLLDALDLQSLTVMTPIQRDAIPAALAGNDLIGLARTGSGKTLAFVLPILERATEGAPCALVVTPTRELALQIHTVFRGLERGSAIPIVGGTPYGSQRKALKRHPKVVVGTPGRLRDLHMRGDLDLASVKTVVLDEADEMLRMGFQDDVEHLLSGVHAERQVLLFSATLPEPMRLIAERVLTEPVTVQVESGPLTVEHIAQQWLRVPSAHKVDTLHLLLLDADKGTTLVFVNTRVGCVDVADQLVARGLAVERLHGGLDQPLRERVLKRVRRGDVKVLVATDVAARGIDVSHIGLVVNADLPESAERYVHRIGRTARAGRSGEAITLVTPKQKRRLREMAEVIGVDLVQGEIPTGGHHRRRRRDTLATDVVAHEPSAHATAFVKTLQQAHGVSAEQIAAAALELLAGTRELPLDPTDDDVVPDWVRPVTERATVERPNAMVITVFAGKEQGITAADIVSALGSEGVTPTQIGRIRMSKRETLVGLTATALHRLKHREHLMLRGQSVAFTR